jgi:putative transcriptional regulator
MRFSQLLNLKSGNPKAKSGEGGADSSIDSSENSLEGHLLIAMPDMQDERFDRAVIYMCAHSSEGAMGLVINRLAMDVKLDELVVQLDLVKEGETMSLAPSMHAMPIFRGGPVELGRGFVLHSPDFALPSATLRVTPDICLSANVDILKALAAGEGPQRAALVLGYAGWSAGQLEAEIQANGWLHCPIRSVDETDIILDANVGTKYQRALDLLGVSLATLSTRAGHA